MKEIRGVIKPLKLRSLSRALGELMGSYRAAIRGNGLEYDDSRRYIPGDDPRMILWRKSTPPDLYVKTCREERDLRVTIFLDVSGSMEGLLGQPSPFDRMKEIATLLVASAVASGDRIGLGYFADRILKYIPHKRGLRHALSLLESIDDLTPVHTTTNLEAALEGFLKARPKRSLLFIITDGIYTTAFEKIFDRVSYHHDVLVINPTQHEEVKGIARGLIPVLDPETNHFMQITLSKKLLDELEHANEEARKAFKAIVTKERASYVEIAAEDNPAAALTHFFEKRRKSRVLR